MTKKFTFSRLFFARLSMVLRVCANPPDDTVLPLFHHKSFLWRRSSAVCILFNENRIRIHTDCDMGSRLPDLFRREDEKIEIRIISVYHCKGGADILKKFVVFPSVVFSSDVDGGETSSQRHTITCSMVLRTIQTMYSMAGTGRNSEDDKTVCKIDILQAKVYLYFVSARQQRI